MSTRTPGPRPDGPARDAILSDEHDGPTRRAFLRSSGAVAGTAGLALPAIATMFTGAEETRAEGAAPAGRDRDPAKVLADLIEGNQRFVQGKPLHPRRRPEDFGPLAEGQAPTTVIVGCSDSRVSPTLLFDQGVGDLFAIRVAGNVIVDAGAAVKGSIEYAVAELGARLIVVLGHSSCGAVKAAIEHIDANDVLPGAIRDLVELVRPAALAVRGKPGNKLENAIRANVLMGVEKLKGLGPILNELVTKGELKVVGAVYELRTGEVQFL